MKQTKNFSNTENRVQKRNKENNVFGSFCSLSLRRVSIIEKLFISCSLCFPRKAVGTGTKEKNLTYYDSMYIITEPN